MLNLKDTNLLNDPAPLSEGTSLEQLLETIKAMPVPRWCALSTPTPYGARPVQHKCSSDFGQLNHPVPKPWDSINPAKISFYYGTTHPQPDVPYKVEGLELYESR